MKRKYQDYDLRFQPYQFAHLDPWYPFWRYDHDDDGDLIEECDGYRRKLTHTHEQE